MEGYALSLQNVQTLTDILKKDILESAALLNVDLFTKLHMKVLTGIEYRHSIIVFNRKAGTTRRYKAGSTLKSAIGVMEERKLEVTLAWNRYYDNIQSYREKEPFSVLGTNQTYNAPNSEFMIRQIGKTFSEDILNNLVWGDKDKADTDLELFDGFDKQIKKDIQRIKVVKTDPITAQPEGQETDNWDAFEGFVNGLDPRMLRQPLVLVYCTPETKRAIVKGYLLRYTGLQSVDVAKEGFRFIGMDNIMLVDSPIFGKGDRLIATVPDNFEYGVDTLNDMAGVSVDHDNDDHNVLIYQIQSAQGVRIARITSDALAISSGNCTPREDMGGDYKKAGIKVIITGGAHDTAVALDPQKDDYAEGEVVTMTITPGAGKQFKKWSDGSVMSPRKIIATGAPEVYEAIFEPSH